MLPLLLLLACGPEATDSAPDATWDRGPNPHTLDDQLRLNHVQVKGTHNSYHLEPDNPVDDSHRYSHPTLTDQLALHHVRQFELDLHRTDAGSFDVFHLPAIDSDTTCLAFTDCLTELKDWSDANGWHLPLVVWLEPKDELDGLADGYQPIGDALFDVDEAIRSVWPDDRLFTPDDLRADHADLPTALAADGWPTLDRVRGKVLFALLDSGSHRDTYVAGNEALEGRVLFVDSSAPTDPYAALVKDGSPADITSWASQGFVITDNGSGAGDSDEQAAAADQSALDAGVHQLATDLPAPTEGYWLDLAPRCNPVTAPAACDPAELEKL